MIKTNKQQQNNTFLTAPNESTLTSLKPSILAGSIAKVCVNNMNRSIARYQLGSFQPDFTLKSARSQLFGASLQSLGVFKTRELLGAGTQKPKTGLAISSEFAKNFTAGVVGGLAMHPCCIPFYYLPAEKNKTGPMPSLNSFVAVVKENPNILKRGVFPRAMSTGTEFGVYFTLKHLLKDDIENPVALEVASSLPAILGAIPWHQQYIDAINNKAAVKTTSDAINAVDKKAISQFFSRHRIAFVLFTATNMLELAILDYTKSKLKHV
jgi:hypothetical protein